MEKVNYLMPYMHDKRPLTFCFQLKRAKLKEMAEERICLRRLKKKLGKDSILVEVLNDAIKYISTGGNPRKVIERVENYRIDRYNFETEMAQNGGDAFGLAYPRNPFR